MPIILTLQPRKQHILPPHPHPRNKPAPPPPPPLHPHLPPPHQQLNLPHHHLPALKLKPNKAILRPKTNTHSSHHPAQIRHPFPLHIRANIFTSLPAAAHPHTWAIAGQNDRRRGVGGTDTVSFPRHLFLFLIAKKRETTTADCTSTIHQKSSHQRPIPKITSPPLPHAPTPEPMEPPNRTPSQSSPSSPPHPAPTLQPKQHATK